MIDIQIKMLVGAGNGPGNPREPRDTELLQAAMPMAIEAVEAEHAVIDCGGSSIGVSPLAIVAAGFLILSRDAIDLVAQQAEPIDTTGNRAVCGWCKRASADVEAVLELPKYAEAEHVEHVTTCRHNPLVAEVARLRMELRCEQIRSEDRGASFAAMKADADRLRAIVGTDHWGDCVVNHGGPACDMGSECGMEPEDRAEALGLRKSLGFIRSKLQGAAPLGLRDSLVDYIDSLIGKDPT